MKNKIITIVLAIILVSFFGYKLYLIGKYKMDKIEFNSSEIFKDTITITKNTNYKGKTITYEGMTFANYFGNYEELPDTTYKVKKDKKGNIISFYSLGTADQYINNLSEASFELYEEGKEKPNIETEKGTRNYLDSHNVKNDIDLLKYLKDNYFLESNILTSSSTMKINYLLNSFVNVSLTYFKSITLIDGDLTGYMITANSSTEEHIKEIHILHEDKQYSILLSGKDITTDEFISKLLSTVTFS